jgi:hypothetical protein
MSLNREQMLEQLHNGVCTVTFTKVNGEQRVMPCTLNHNLLPPVTIKEATVKERKVSMDTIRVYCTDKQEWRSFRVDSVIEFTGA